MKKIFKFLLLAAGVAVMTTSCEAFLAQLEKPIFFVPPVMIPGQEFDITKLSAVECNWEIDKPQYVTFVEGKEKTIRISLETPDYTPISITATDIKNAENTHKVDFVVNPWYIAIIKDGKQVTTIGSEEATFQVCTVAGALTEIPKGVKLSGKDLSYEVVWEYDNTQYEQISATATSVKLKLKAGAVVDKMAVKGSVCGGSVTLTPTKE